MLLKFAQKIKAYIAKEIFFDNSTNGFTAIEVQSAIEEVFNKVQTSASPGFTWGRSGTLPPGTYLLNDNVPSNVVGRIVPITSGNIEEIFVAVETAGTFTFSVERRVGVVYTEIVAVTVTAARKANFGVSVPVTYGDELCVLVKSTSAGSPKNPVVGLVIKGNV